MEYKEFRWELNFENYVDLIYFGQRRIPNFYDVFEYYQKIEKPYLESTLPNLKTLDGCINCKYVEVMDGGPHNEYSCGVCRDYIHGINMICDLWELKSDFL